MNRVFQFSLYPDLDLFFYQSTSYYRLKRVLFCTVENDTEMMHFINARKMYMKNDISNFHGIIEDDLNLKIKKS